MDSLQDLLAKRSPVEPPEIAAIKKYIAEHFNGRTVKIKLTPEAIVISVNSAAFVGALRMHLVQLKAIAHTEKRITLHIGS